MTKKHAVIAGLAALVFLAAPASAEKWTASLSAAQVPDGSASTASGTASFSLNAIGGDTLTYTITLVGLDLDGLQTPGNADDDVVAFHIHKAPAGSTGPVIFGFIAPGDDDDDLVVDPVAGTLTGAWEETDTLTFGSSLSAELADLQAGNLYLNVHTPAHPAGDIRGQILPVMLAPAVGTVGLAILAFFLLAAITFVLWRQKLA